MISLKDVSLHFGGRTLFENISFMINTGDRIGLTGKNGAGKSTMLRLIEGTLIPDAGTVSTSKNLRTGHLKQEIEFTDGRTVEEEAESAFEKVKAIEKELDELKIQLTERTDTDSQDYFDLITRTGELEERFVQLDGYSIHSDVSRVLLGLGFVNTDFNKPTNTFSGGWRMRIELAKLLLQKPESLLLDEPTNHLDIESIIWLEGVLKNYKGSVLLVSHDRTFLDAVTNRTIEISNGVIHDYKAPYSKYIELRKERQLKQEQAKKNQDKYIKHTEDLIDRFRYKKSKASFAQSLIKKLDKIELIEVDSFDHSAMHFRFPPSPHSGKLAFKAEHISKSYGLVHVLQNVSLEVGKGEKIAFVGKNGEGKTTLARIIAGRLDYEGNIEYGHLVKVGYYAQNQSELLDDNLTVLETIDRAANNETAPKVRNILGSFLFSGDDANKKIKVLSGGERARVALCKLLMEPVNLLVMDEPTNHLDMLSKDILKKALLAYDSTLVVVSHDRDFLLGLTDKVYEFRNRNIKEYIGDINAFLEVRKVADFRNLEMSPIGRQPVRWSKSPSFAKKKNQEKLLHIPNLHEKEKQREKELKKANILLSKLEQDIGLLEKNLKELDVELADPVRFKELSIQKGFFEEYQNKQNQLKALMQEWESVSGRVEEMSRE